MLYKQLTAWALTLALLICCVPALAENAVTFEGPGYPTPEEALQAYIDFWAADDLDGMISVYAIEHYVDHLDAEEMLRIYRYYNSDMLTSNQLMCFVPQLRQQMVYSRLGIVVDELQYRFLYLHADKQANEALFNSGTLSFARDRDNSKLDAFLSCLQPYADVPTCTVQLVSFVDPDEISDGKYTISFLTRRENQSDPRSTQELYRDIYGADDLRECVALLTVDGHECYLGLWFGCWNGSWYIVAGRSIVLSYFGVSSATRGVVFLDDIDR